MNVLEPLTIQSSPSRTAEVRIPCEVAARPGSVIAMAMMSSPLAMPGSQRFFCSLVGQVDEVRPHDVVVQTQGGRGDAGPTISSSMMALNRKSSVPPPPYSSGMLVDQAVLARRHGADLSTRRSASHFSALGTSSVSM